MNRAQLVRLIQEKQSYLCVGLDIDLDLVPSFVEKSLDGQWDFLKLVIDTTSPFCVAYKPNLAFYESQGILGYTLLERVCRYVKEQGAFLITDAKRGDIGNTALQYARAAYDGLHADGVTVAPYMGKDSILPFLSYSNKWAIVLGLTSNEGSKDFQQLRLETGSYLYETVLKSISTWGTAENLMFVVGATKASLFRQIREILPNHFLLVPGVGTQGGDLAELSKFGLIDDCGLLVNVGRALLYPNCTDWSDLSKKIASSASYYQGEMKRLLESYSTLPTI